MTEQLKRLSLMAGGSNYPIINPQLQQKFAELIIQECAGIVADAVDHREPASTYADKIRKHFGISE
jgi:hypothetical protein